MLSPLAAMATPRAAATHVELKLEATTTATTTAAATVEKMVEYVVRVPLGKTTTACACMQVFVTHFFCACGTARGCSLLL